MKNNYCVIMAGGIGSRFWPMSTEETPKQFLDILGTGKSLIRQTFERFSRICPPENFLVVTNEKYKSIVKEQIPEMNSDNILCEPFRKNTAPCIAYAAFRIKSKNQNANVVVTPADHLVLKEEIFEETILTAINQANQNKSLVTLGIKPSRPDTGYGYIQFYADNRYNSDSIKKVKTFTEKPNHELAKAFIESGDYYWNSGIFIWRNQDILSAFESLMNELYSLFNVGYSKMNTPNEQEFINETFIACPNISIDYGIMEKAENVDVVLADFGWSDLGTWGSLYTHLEKDNSGNSVLGNKTNIYDSSNCIVKMPNGKTVVIQGLDDYIVVDSNETLLICKKADEQKIKQFVSDLK